MSYTINLVLEQIEKIYKQIDIQIKKAGLEGGIIHLPKEAGIKDILLESMKVKNPILRNYIRIILQEAEYFSSPRTLEQTKEYYYNNYNAYFSILYQNPPEALQYLDEPNYDISGLEDKDIAISEQNFIAQIISTAHELGLSKGIIDTISIKPTHTTIANYNYKEKTIYINPALPNNNFKLYVILHEMMHHIHFSHMDHTIYVSEYDYGAGIREGIAINLSEYFVQKSFKFLEYQHYNYLNYTKERGKASYKILHNECTIEDFSVICKKYNLSAELAFLQYLSCFTYPGYKESYYVYYKQMQRLGLDGHKKIITMPNLAYTDLIMNNI